MPSSVACESLIPLPRLSAGTRFFQKPKRLEDMLRIVEELWECSGAALCS